MEGPADSGSSQNSRALKAIFHRLKKKIEENFCFTLMELKLFLHSRIVAV